MKKSLLVRLVIMFLTASALSACLMVPVDGGRGGGGSHGGGRGGGGEHHGGPGGR